jgi:mono/diheme cytochrome c family protein
MGRTGSRRGRSGAYGCYLRAAVFGGALMLTAAVILLGLRASPEQGPASEAPVVTSADPGDAAAVAQGRVVYERSCVACHGASFERRPPGQTSPGILANTITDRTDAELFAITKYGGQAASAGGAMPGFGGALSDSEIWAVLAFIRSLSPPGSAAEP